MTAQDATLLSVDDGGRGGLPLVFLHSLAGNVGQWEPQLEEFRKSRRAMAIDLPGHGASPIPADYGIPSQAAAVTTTLDQLGLDRFVLIGHSAGAAVAIALAARHPDRVAGLLLLDPVGDQRQASAEEIRGFLEALRSPTYRTTIEAYWRSILVGSDSAVAAAVLGDLRATPRQSVVATFEALLEYDPVADLRAYDGPVLSVITPLNQAPFSLHNLIEDLPVETIEGTGHWIQLDRPDTVNRLIEDFLVRAG